MVDDNYISDDGELISSTIATLQLDLSHIGAERDMLRQAYDLSQARNEALGAALVEARHDVQVLQDRLATTEVIPPGAMTIMGRLVNVPGGNVAVVTQGRPVRLALVPGWEWGLPDGAPVVVSATLDRGRGWTVWSMHPAAHIDAAKLPPLDAKLVEKLATPLPKADPAAKLEAVEDLDLDRVASESDLRLNSHNASQIALHVVFARWRRGKNMPLTDAMASCLKLDIKAIVEGTLGWKVLAVNTGSIDPDHKHDHLHLAVSGVDPSKSLTHELGRLKAISSKRLRARFPEIAGWAHLWSAGMYLGAFGGPNRDSVIQYVRAQEQ